METFSAQIERQVVEAKALLTRVVHEAIATTVEEMLEAGVSRAAARDLAASGAGLGRLKQDGTRGVSKKAMGPVPSPGATGNLPVVTGFLRSSFVMGPSPLPMDDRNPGQGRYNLDRGYEAVINNLKLGDTIYGSFTATYAARIEYGYSGTDSLGRHYSDPPHAFVRLALQNWQRNVDAAVAKMKGAARG